MRPCGAYTCGHFFGGNSDIIKFFLDNEKVALFNIEPTQYDWNINITRNAYKGDDLAQYKRTFENELLDLINGYRAKNGLAPLKRNHDLKEGDTIKTDYLNMSVS